MLVGFMIELSIDGVPALFIGLSADGAVNRAGSGKVSSDEKDVFIAQTDGSFFRQVAPLFDSSWLQRPGLYQLPGQVGPHHRLVLSFLPDDHRPVALGFDYRVDSPPPPAIQAFVQRALEVTQGWYDDQRRMAAEFDAGSAPTPTEMPNEKREEQPKEKPTEKPWWKFFVVALAVLSSACGRSHLMLQLWGPEMGDRFVSALVRVELRGTGSLPWERAPTALSGADEYGVYGRSGPVTVPTRGTLLVRVALVARTGDTLARSAWDTIQLERSYQYWIVVAVADSSGPHDMCTPTFKSYPIPPNRFVSHDSLLVDVDGMPRGAVC